MKPDGGLVRRELHDQVVHVLMADGIEPAVAVNEAPGREEHELVELGETHGPGDFDVPRRKRGGIIEGPGVGKDFHPDLLFRLETVLPGHDLIGFLQGVDEVVREDPVLLLVQEDDEMGTFDFVVGDSKRRSFDSRKRAKALLTLVFLPRLRWPTSSASGPPGNPPGERQSGRQAQELGVLRFPGQKRAHLHPGFFHIPSLQLLGQGADELSEETVWAGEEKGKRKKEKEKTQKPQPGESASLPWNQSPIRVG